MTRSVKEFASDVQRLLVLESDNAEELARMAARARGRGWQDYVEGAVPNGPIKAIWMLKGVDPHNSTHSYPLE